MKAKYYLLAALAAALTTACYREPIPVPDIDDKTYEFGLVVRNTDYTEEVVLEGVGETSLVSADNLPSWVGGVSLSEESVRGNPVALVDVKGDMDLKEERTATLVLKMGSGATVNLTLDQWPLLREKTNETYASLNTEFEDDWAAAKEIDLIISNTSINGRPEIETVRVSLPWDWDHLPACYLPKGNGEDEQREVYKMIANKGDWSLAFNLTGIQSRPNYNYFGLYNRYTGTLRVFFYFTEGLIPTTNTNDHLWAFAINNKLAEHGATQFALPYKRPATSNFRAMASKPVLSSPLTDSYNPFTTGGQTIPAVGWWAFDVNLSAYRPHKFFDESVLSAFDIYLCTYEREQVLLNSVIQGKLDGVLTGKMNLDALAPEVVNTAGKVCSAIFGTVGSGLTNTYLLGLVGGQAGAAAVANPANVVIPEVPAAPQSLARRPIIRPRSATAATVMLVVGVVCTLAGKIAEIAGTERMTDDDLGKINGKMSLDLNAVMNTAGTIGGPTTNKVPSASMSMDYLRKTNKDGSPTGLGEGIWNLDNHPVVYIVKDAYWCENQFTSLSARKEYPLGDTDIYSYDIGDTPGDRPAFRLISFLDPTSVEGVSFNEQLFDKEFKTLRVYLSYGVYPGTEPGYTDSFRQAVDLDYPHTWRLCEKNDKFNSKKEIKTFKRLHTDTLFVRTAIPNELREVAGYRLSSQALRSDIPRLERRYYGASLYYDNPYATEYDVDRVQFVYDPQIYLPFDEAGNRLYDPQVPDLVVSAAIFANGRDQNDEEGYTLTSTLRFVPEIRLVSYKDLPDIYEEILERKGRMTGFKKTTTIWMDMNNQVDHIKAIVDCTK
jgi:hypothetical protein